MATTGNTGWLATSNSAITQKMSWRITTGTATTNKSTVECWYYLKKNPAIQNSTTSSTDSNFTMTVDGQTHKIQHTTVSVPADNAEHLVISRSFSVSHNSDGTKSVTMSVVGGLAGTTISSLKVSKTLSLPTIPRASTITSVSNITLGNAPSVKWTPLAKSYYFKIKFSIGSWSHTTGAIHPNTTSAYTYSGYTVPIDVANQITLSSTGTMTALLYTYSDSACKTQVGSAQNKTFTVAVPSSLKPYIVSYTLSSVTSDPVVESWGINLEGYTRFRIVAEGNTQYGAEVLSFNLNGAYNTTVYPTSSSPWYWPLNKDIDYTGPTITGAGTKDFILTLTDSRGNVSAAQTNSALVYPYSKPTITSFIANRNTSNGTSLDIRLDCTYSSCNDNNSLTAVLRYKEAGAPSYTEYGTISVNESIVVPIGLSEEHRYDLQVLIEDSLGNTALATAEIPTATVLLDFRAGGKGLGIGKIAETDMLEVGLDSNFFGDMYIDSIPLLDYIDQAQQAGYGLTISDHTITIVKGGSTKSVTVPDNNTTYVLSGSDLTNGYQLTLTSSGTDTSSVTIGQLTEQDIDDILFGT